MTKAIIIDKTGGSESLKLQSVSLAAPAAGEVRVRHEAIGLNFIDVYHRTGLYPVPSLPSGLGMEAAGVVEAIGEGVSEVAVGDRVAYAGGPLGAYSDERIIPASLLVKLPDSIDSETAAAMMLQGMTAQYLIRSTYRVKAGETIVLHAAAGGVGSLLSQWASSLGVTVIGTVGSEEKAQLAQANGCAHTILYNEENFSDRVREITNGEGVPVVYDSVGKDTFEGSLDCLSVRGLMVSYGNASGAVPPFSPGILAQKGSLYLTRPTLASYTRNRAELSACAGELMSVVSSGTVKISVNQRYALADVASAHDDLEARKTTGQTVLIPD